MSAFVHFLQGQTFVTLQWIYALWQIVRETPPVRAAFYWMQMLVCKELRFATRKNMNLIDPDETGHSYMDLEEQPENRNRIPEVLYLSNKYQFNRSYIRTSAKPTWEDFRKEYLDDPKKKEAGMNGVKLISFKDYWYKVEFEGSFYYCHQNVLFEWVMYDIANTKLLINAQNFTKDLVLGQKVTPKEFFEGLLSMDMHINELYAPCIFGTELSVKVSLRLSTALATVPLLLQARKLAVESAVATLAIIFLDLFRVPLYNIYDSVMFYVSKYVKLYIFRKWPPIYTFFGWFSKRWSACDKGRGYAYITDRREKYPVTTFVKFANEKDVDMVGIAKRGKPCIESYGLQIDGGVIYAAEFGYGEHCVYVIPEAGMIVS